MILKSVEQLPKKVINHFRNISNIHNLTINDLGLVIKKLNNISSANKIKGITYSIYEYSINNYTIKMLISSNDKYEEIEHISILRKRKFIKLDISFIYYLFNFSKIELDEINNEN